MKFQALPSTISEGRAVNRQHMVCIVVDDRVAFDAGSLATSATAEHRRLVRDVILSHAHLDHISGLPLFLDDMFAILEEPVRVHAFPEVIEVLENDIFNWRVYPRFLELENEHGKVLSYHPLESGRDFQVGGLTVTPISVHHGVPSCGFIATDGKATIALSGDTGATDGFWDAVNGLPNLDCLIVECAMPERLAELAERSHHLTPSSLKEELGKLKRRDARVIAGNIKPMYFDEVVNELGDILPGAVEILEVGKEYVL